MHSIIGASPSVRCADRSQSSRVPSEATSAINANAGALLCRGPGMFLHRGLTGSRPRNVGQRNGQSPKAEIPLPHHSPASRFGPPDGSCGPEAACDPQPESKDATHQAVAGECGGRGMGNLGPRNPNPTLTPHGHFHSEGAPSGPYPGNFTHCHALSQHLVGIRKW
jgi:hypothetical protein